MISLINKILKRLSPDTASPISQIDYKHIELFYWKPPFGGMNFGDHLSSIIVNKILADHNLSPEEETTESRRLLALGSILHFAKDNDVVWGSGVNGKINVEAHTFKSLDVRAVRGPLTQEFLARRGIKVPDVFGDPALLLPAVFKDKFAVNLNKKYVIVPNLHDLKITTDRKWKNVISPYLSWNKCIEEILSAELVIASSLHGLIIAEAYGIPARYIRLSEEENLFKYNDYLMGSGRGEIVFARSLEEAIEMGGMEPLKFDPNALLEAFPFDLWN